MSLWAFTGLLQKRGPAATKVVLDDPVRTQSVDNAY